MHQQYASLYGYPMMSANNATCRPNSVPSSVLLGVVGLLEIRPSQRDSCPFFQVKGTQVVWLCSHPAIRKGSLHVPTALDLCALASVLQPNLNPILLKLFPAYQLIWLLGDIGIR